ncbi:MAG TPA: hypothetical protein VIS49_14850 [Cyclobacteriaceae bacterium]
MKLQQTQYQEILNALDDFQITHELLFLVKKKGRVRVQIEGVDSAFEFFKRESGSLAEETKE